MNKIVTIIVPCYNGEKYIDSCFKCILEQSYDEIEIIFVNDGSNDQSMQKAKAYIGRIQQRGYQIRLLEEENAGAASAVNMALKYVTGSYIMLFDVDDFLFKDAVKKKVEFLMLHPEYGMVRNNGYYNKIKNVHDNSYLFIRKGREKKNEWIFEDILLGKTNNWSGSFMVRTECLFDVIKDKNIYISRYGQNMQIMMPVAYKYRTGYIDEPLMRYINHGNSVSKTKSIKGQLELINGFEDNRINIVRNMEIDNLEKKIYIKKVNIYYNKIRLRFAANARDIELATKMKQNLILNNQYDIKDRWNWICVNCMIVNRMTNFVNMTKGIIGAVIQKIEGVLFRSEK